MGGIRRRPRGNGPLLKGIRLKPDCQGTRVWGNQHAYQLRRSLSQPGSRRGYLKSRFIRNSGLARRSRKGNRKWWRGSDDFQPVGTPDAGIDT